MTRTSVYFSRSFRPEDEEVYLNIRAVFDALRPEFDLDLFDSLQPTNKQVAAKLLADLSAASLVTCIFTRRYQIGSSQEWAPPPYVIAEGAAAYALGKIPFVFLESGVEPDHLGLLSALNTDRFAFSREHSSTNKFHNATKDAVRKALTERKKSIVPDYVFERYEPHVTVYPDGYVMVTNRYAVSVSARTPIRHAFTIFRRPGDTTSLPTAQELLENADREVPHPFPKVPFTAFVSSPRDVGIFKAIGRTDSNTREYEIQFKKDGTYSYEWIWGTANCFDPDSQVDFHYIPVSQRDIRRLRIILRRHRRLAGRRSPRLAAATALSIPPSEWQPAHIEELYLQGMAPDPGTERQTAFFDTFEFSLSPLPRAIDFVLLY